MLFLPVDNWVWPCLSSVKIMQNAEGIFICLVSLCNSDVKAKTESKCHKMETTRYSEYSFINIDSIIDRRFKS